MKNPRRRKRLPDLVFERGVDDQIAEGRVELFDGQRPASDRLRVDAGDVVVEMHRSGAEIAAMPVQSAGVILSGRGQLVA